MNKKQLLYALGVIIVGLSIFGANLSTKPRNPSYASFDDCVLKNIKDAQSDTAAMLVKKSCQSLFPKKYLTDEEFLGNNSKN